MIRVGKPYWVYLIKSSQGEGYAVFTYSESEDEHQKVSPYLTFDEAQQIKKGFYMAGYKNKHIRHEVDMI